MLSSVNSVASALPLDVVTLLDTLRSCTGIIPCPALVYDIQRYQSSNKDKCCQADEYPHLFGAFAGLSICIENLVQTSSQILCRVLSILGPLAGCDANNPSAGCLLTALLDALFGKIGSLLVS